MAILLLAITGYEFESCHFKDRLPEMSLGYLDLFIGIPTGLLGTQF